MWQTGEVNNGGQSREKRLASLGALLAYDPVAGEEGPPAGDGSGPPLVIAAGPVAVPRDAEPAVSAAAEGAPAGDEHAVAGCAAPPGAETHGLPEIQSAARDIAQTLTGILSSAISEVNQRTDDNRRQIDGVVERIGNMGERVARAEERIESVHDRQQGLGEQIQAIAGRMSSIESRMGDLAGRLDEITADVRRQAEALAGLSASSATLARSHQSLHARLLLTERALRAAQMDHTQSEVAWQRFLNSLKSLELRGEKRFPTSESVRAVLAGDEERTLNAQLVDVSDRGLGLFLDQEVPAGSVMRIDVEDASLSGTVRYCRPQAEGFAVGVLLEQPLRSQGEEAK